ncbi:hypothetical protein BDB00DRAFT_816460 [Zychaea mexicana]|uniref:uncharacterized protein n=1 Tax=Zychaea mexicana TaxID=64656 RepID=UPI0022FDE1C0|nr:uncharacterized protein BDB00DRAFT_816460 [Zychaea mexicana]KAI9494962.1 hypothetical protein BDB00DRAFT_816460 [Zychaea mexicana]
MAGPGDAMTTSSSSSTTTTTTTTTTAAALDNSNGNSSTSSSNNKHRPTFADQLQTFDFRGDAVDMALRKLLAKAHLPKEAQQIDRAMEDFAKRYHECNPGLADSPDAAYAVAFLLLLLHTDAHNKNVRQKMNKDTFIMRKGIVEGGENVPAEILDIMYDNIVSTEFTYAEGNDDDLFRARTPTSWFGRLARSESSSALTPANAVEDLYPKLTQLMPPENSFHYKRIPRPIQLNEAHMAFHHARPLSLGGVRGRHNSSNDGSNTYTIRVAKAAIIERKYDMLPGGKRATARGWRPFGVILSGTQIIFFADVLAFDSWLAEEERRERESPRQCSTTTTSSRPASERTSSSSSSSSTPPPFRFPSVSTSTIDTTSHSHSFTSSIYSTHSLTNSIVPIPSSPSTPIINSSPNNHHNNLLRPVQIISLADAVCIYDESYTKYPHVFRLMTGDGQLFLIRAKSDADMDDWMTKINYAATIKTTGVRLKPSSPSSSRHHHHGGRSSGDRVKREERAKVKILELSHKMVELERLLERDLQLRRNLMVLVPLQKPSKERILYFAEMVGRRVHAKRLEMQRLECYREFLEVALSQAEAVAATMTTRKMSAPLLSRSLVPANILAAHRSATSPALAQIDREAGGGGASSLPPRSYTVSPMPFDDDHGEVMWSQTGEDTPSSSSEMLKPAEDEKSTRRSSCPQIPPFPFTMEEIPSSSSSSSSAAAAAAAAASSDVAVVIARASTTGAAVGGGGSGSRSGDTTPLEKHKDKSVAFDVPSEADAKNSKWMRRRSSSNPVKPVNNKLLGNRERSSSEASSVRDDDELTIVNVATGDDDDPDKNDGNVK